MFVGNGVSRRLAVQAQRILDVAVLPCGENLVWFYSPGGTAVLGRNELRIDSS